MPAPVNILKERLAAREVQIGAWLALASPAVAEIAGGAGYDWCLVDGEHGPNTVASIQAQLMALAGMGTPAAVRVPAGEDWLLKQVLDLGAQTVVVPMVDTPEEAAAVARAVRYPPEGGRGLASALVRASGYGADAEYAATANAQVLLFVQAESRSAVENIDAIAATEGVDGVFIGPADLAADMGHLGNPTAPEVVAAIDHVLARTQAAGKIAAYLSFDPEPVPALVAKGVTFFAVAGDVPALGSALRERAAIVRAKLA